MKDDDFEAWIYSVADVMLEAKESGDAEAYDFFGLWWDDLTESFTLSFMRFIADHCEVVPYAD